MSEQRRMTHEDLRERRKEIRNKFNSDPVRWTIQRLASWYGVSTNNIYKAIREKTQ